MVGDDNGRPVSCVAEALKGAHETGRGSVVVFLSGVEARERVCFRDLVIEEKRGAPPQPDEAAGVLAGASKPVQAVA